MIEGLYLSATGIMTSSYRQDVLANNLANSETAGFKRDVALFKQRLTAAEESRRPGDWSDPVLEGLGGGTLSMPTRIDFTQGDMQESGSPLDVAITGDGFFTVRDHDQTRLTRDGRFVMARDGQLTLARGQKVLDAKGQPITLATDSPASIDAQGQISQNGQVVARLGVVDVADKSTLTKLGGGLFAVADAATLTPSQSQLRSGFIERSNVDPTMEMTELMDAQRQLEANANMIRTQDSTLQRLVNDVGKIS